VTAPKFLFVVPVTYLLAVIGCVLLAFDYTGRIDSGWVVVLICLTLPWSIVSFIFMWSLFHGAGLGFFTVMYLLFAGINAFILYRISLVIYRSFKKEAGPAVEPPG
jgi:hypothetical protein